MNAWITFGAAVVGGAVAAIAALGGVALGQRGENARATKLDQQRLRDAKAERLRRLYEPFVEFAMALRQIASEKVRRARRRHPGGAGRQAPKAAR